MVRTGRLKPVVLVRIGMAASAAASLVAFFRVSDSPGYFQFDDAYIFLRYAKHFLSGHGFSWNPDEGPAYGATSALHLFALTVGRGLTSVSDTQLLIGASTAAGLLACGVLVVLGFLVLPGGAARRSWVPLAIVPLLVLSTWFQFHSRSGMETMLSLLCNALLAVSVVVFTRRRSRGLLALCVFAGYLSYLARPDNGATCLLFPPLFFLASDRRLRTAAAAYVVIFAALVVADLFLKARLFGDAIPLSFFAKQNGFYSGYVGAHHWNAAAYVLAFMADCLPWLTLIIAFADRSSAPLLVASLAPVAITFGYYLSVTQIMGFWARYYFPFLPFVVLAALTAIRGAGQDWPDRLARLRATWVPRAVLIAGVVLVTASPARALAARAWVAYVIGQPVTYRAHQRYVTPVAPALPYVGPAGNLQGITAVLEEAPPDTVFAASEYGYIGSTLADVTIVDVLGLNDRRVAHEGFSAEYLFSRHPDIIWLPHYDYSRMVAEILDSPVFSEDYEYFPGAFEFGLALNKQSPRFDSIKPAVERAFALVYSGRRLADYQGRAVSRN